MWITEMIDTHSGWHLLTKKLLKTEFSIIDWANWKPWIGKKNDNKLVSRNEGPQSEGIKVYELVQPYRRETLKRA